MASRPLRPPAATPPPAPPTAEPGAEPDTTPRRTRPLGKRASPHKAKGAVAEPEEPDPGADRRQRSSSGPAQRNTRPKISGPLPPGLAASSGSLFSSSSAKAPSKATPWRSGFTDPPAPRRGRDDRSRSPPTAGRQGPRLAECLVAMDVPLQEIFERVPPSACLLPDEVFFSDIVMKGKKCVSVNFFLV